MIKLHDLLKEVEEEQLEEASAKSIAAGIAMTLASMFPQKVKAQQATEKPGVVQTMKASDTMNVNMGTLFGSGRHTITDKESLQRVLSQVSTFMAKNPTADYQVTIKSSESKVPNRDAERAGNPKVDPGFLASKRADEVEKVLAQFVKAAKETGAFKGNVTFSTEELVMQGPAWNPKDNTEDPKYKAHQFVDVGIKAVGQPDSDTNKIDYSAFANTGEVMHKNNQAYAMIFMPSRASKSQSDPGTLNTGYQDVLLRVVKPNKVLTGNIAAEGDYIRSYKIPYDVWNAKMHSAHDMSHIADIEKTFGVKPL